MTQDADFSRSRLINCKCISLKNGTWPLSLLVTELTFVWPLTCLNPPVFIISDSTWRIHLQLLTLEITLDRWILTLTGQTERQKEPENTSYYSGPALISRSVWKPLQLISHQKMLHHLEPYQGLNSTRPSANALKREKVTLIIIIIIILLAWSTILCILYMQHVTFPTCSKSFPAWLTCRIGSELNK